MYFRTQTQNFILYRAASNTIGVLTHYENDNCTHSISHKHPTRITCRQSYSLLKLCSKSKSTAWHAAQSSCQALPWCIDVIPHPILDHFQQSVFNVWIVSTAYSTSVCECVVWVNPSSTVKAPECKSLQCKGLIRTCTHCASITLIWCKHMHMFWESACAN